MMCTRFELILFIQYLNLRLIKNHSYHSTIHDKVLSNDNLSNKYFDIESIPRLPLLSMMRILSGDSSSNNLFMMIYQIRHICIFAPNFVSILFGVI